MSAIIAIFLFCASMAFLISCIYDWRKLRIERQADDDNRAEYKRLRLKKLAQDKFHGEETMKIKPAQKRILQNFLTEVVNGTDMSPEATEYQLALCRKVLDDLYEENSKLDVKAEQEMYRKEAEVHKGCIKCKGVTACTGGGRSYLGCILCRKPEECSGPFEDWETFFREEMKED
jgi:hypothetical protein